jgi:hypothetical protein
MPTPSMAAKYAQRTSQPRVLKYLPWTEPLNLSMDSYFYDALQSVARQMDATRRAPCAGVAAFSRKDRTPDPDPFVRKNLHGMSGAA